MIEVICKELYNTKLLVLETPVPIPSADKIKITILELNLLNTNPELVIVAQPVFITKSKKLPNPLIFDGNQNDLCPFVTKLRLKLLMNDDRYPTEASKISYRMFYLNKDTV